MSTSSGAADRWREIIRQQQTSGLPVLAFCRRAGVPQVGILVSSLYASLHPGYTVVFSGVYATGAAASAALANVHARGFPGAYQARVARR